MSYPIRVLNVTPEAVPLAKAGGLADVTGALPSVLKNLGIDARIILPAWNEMLDQLNTEGIKTTRLPGNLEIFLNGKLYKGSVHLCEIDYTIFYLVQQRELFSSPIYAEQNTLLSPIPFAFLCYSALLLPTIANWDPQIYHCHDWTSSLVPISIRWNSKFKDQHKNRKTVFSIHNITHQGIFSREKIEALKLPPDSFSVEKLEFYGSLNLLKGALISSDWITTVSKNYAKEIKTKEKGERLDGVIREHEYKLTGILNGLDYDSWNPETDSTLAENYSIEKFYKKQKNRQALLNEANLSDEEGPTAVMISRLVEQKGLDILIPAIPSLLNRGLKLIIIGSGEEKYERKIAEEEKKHPDRLRFFNRYCERLGRLGYAGGDIYLMPSRFEPCGLSQIIALRYGTVPVVHHVGGLVDTVSDVSAKGNGFIFSKYSTEAFIEATLRCIEAYEDQDLWEKIAKRGMRGDLSWNSSAPEYANIYKKILKN